MGWSIAPSRAKLDTPRGVNAPGTQERALEMAKATGRRLIVLGSGTSTGVPVIGCDCAVCLSTDPCNNRTRASVVLELPEGRVLIDTTPEMRVQLLRERIGRIHAIVYTHSHADHLFGLDDARMFPKYLKGPIPIYCEGEVEDVIRRAFDYASKGPTADGPWVGLPQVDFHRIGPGVPFRLLGQEFHPIRLDHGHFRVLGFRVGDLAYCTDVSRIPEPSWSSLEGLDVLILDALRREPHPTHFSLPEALEVVERLRPRRTYLTHISHALDHATTERELPPGVALAYDGLALDF
jgi:phosphoribosyl 1,2-cyclic phosphate phosphodiesterase